jgi:hypothetical protein
MHIAGTRYDRFLRYDIASVRTKLSMIKSMFLHSVPLPLLPGGATTTAATGGGDGGAAIGVGVGGAAPGDGVGTVQILQLRAQFAVMNATFDVHSPVAAQPAHDGALAAASAHTVGASVGSGEGAEDAEVG